MTWHVNDQLWAAYADGRLGHSAATAVEAHVEQCSRCQLSAAAGAPLPTAVWEAVHADISTPPVPWPVSWLRRVGLSSEDAAILAAANSMRLAWALALGGALTSVIVSANLGAWHAAAFMMLGPLIPVLAVLAAFDATDPLRELVAATPLPKLRLGLLRVVSTLAVAVPALICLTAVVPVLQPQMWTWLLPSLGLTCAALILLRWLRPVQAAAGVVAGWSIAVVAVKAAGDLARLSTVTGQIAFATATVVAAAAYLIMQHAPQPIEEQR